ncbi:MAG: ethanolamine ammonia-lyase subunit EutB [Lachnospiraceae bacterium]|nr:ethanolamine ammonia-lyase subunit EutB [Lachnospiraceae bacterium]
MILKTRLYGKVYAFSSVKEVLAKASELKSGDCLAGVAAESTLERIAAKVVLSDLTIKDLRENPVVPYEEDSITRMIQDDLDMKYYNKVKNWSLAELREWILAGTTTSDRIMEVSKGLTSEVISGVSKLMGNMDLVYASRKMHVTATCNTTIGEDGVLATRLQPNHPVDDVKGVTASILEGLSYGIGDAVLGLNPAIDTVDSTLAIWNVLGDIRDKYEIPTQTCVLSHVTTQMEALRKGGKADLCFQSIAGSQKACEAFGITTELLEEAQQMFLTEGSAKGKNVMYFETGQASELSSSAHYDSDQVTMECRCYGLARHYHPFLLNTVVGFMGPEYIYDTKQLIRAGLEDVFNGHLHGLPMGCDICYTNHMPTDQNDAETLAILLANANCHYVMGLPQGDDIMLMYQSTGYHDDAALREITNKRPIWEFEQWLETWDLWKNGRLGSRAGDPTVFLRKK